MPKQLRYMFARILIHCSIAEPIKLWDKFKHLLSQDYRRYNTEIDSLKLSYKFIINILKRENKEDDLNIPDLNVLLNEDIINEHISNTDEEECLAKGQAMYTKLNPEQKSFVDKILQAVLNGDEINNCYFISSFGGSGKTFLYNTLYYLARGHGKKISTMALTGIAGTLLPSGQTIHKTFGLPVPIFSDSNSSISNETKQSEDLLSTDLFIIDEAPAAIRYAYEIMDRLLRDLTKNEHLPFGGKIIVAGGDFRQTLPIQKNANRPEIISLSMKNSPLWIHFQQFTLTQNMRTLPSETDFSNFLLKLGNGELNDEKDHISLSVGRQ